jgi:hypothetical protein
MAGSVTTTKRYGLRLSDARGLVRCREQALQQLLWHGVRPLATHVTAGGDDSVQRVGDVRAERPPARRVRAFSGARPVADARNRPVTGHVGGPSRTGRPSATGAALALSSSVLSLPCLGAEGAHRTAVMRQSLLRAGGRGAAAVR